MLLHSAGHFLKKYTEDVTSCGKSAENSHQMKTQGKSFLIKFASIDLKHNFRQSFSSCKF